MRSRPSFDGCKVSVIHRHEVLEGSHLSSSFARSGTEMILAHISKYTISQRNHLVLLRFRTMSSLRLPDKVLRNGTLTYTHNYNITQCPCKLHSGDLFAGCSFPAVCHYEQWEVVIDS